MSDIFISYSKADHALALKLSAFLESEGWSVWWDKSLGAADLYRDEIMKQLAAARAVITIWTENSVRSDWVRAEAGRAKADGKLIPVKTPDLTYGDIPLPFGEMQHRECRIERFNQGGNRRSTCKTCGTAISIPADHKHLQIPNPDLDRHCRECHYRFWGSEQRSRFGRLGKGASCSLARMESGNLGMGIWFDRDKSAERVRTVYFVYLVYSPTGVRSQSVCRWKAVS
jgi:hypothetical protein